MMNYIWGAMLVAGVCFSVANGKTSEFTDSLMSGCTDAVHFIISLAGIDVYKRQVHYHYQRQEAYYGTYTADDTVSQYSLEQRRAVLQQSCYVFLERFDPSYEPVCDEWSQR